MRERERKKNRKADEYIKHSVKKNTSMHAQD